MVISNIMETIFLLIFFFMNEISSTVYMNMTLTYIDDYIVSIYKMINKEYTYFYRRGGDTCGYTNTDCVNNKMKTILYNIGEAINVHIADSGGQVGYYAFNITINEYFIHVEHLKFWDCTDCKTNTFNYNYYSGKYHFYSSGGVSGVYYNAFFQVKKYSDLNYEGNDVNPNYYRLASRELYNITINNLNEEVNLINFNQLDIFYIDFNPDNLEVEYSNYYFRIFFEESEIYKLIGLDLADNNLNIELKNGDNFMTNDNKPLRFKLLKNIFDNNEIILKIKIMAYNSPKKLSNTHSVSNEAEYTFYIHQKEVPPITCNYFTYISFEQLYYANEERTKKEVIDDLNNIFDCLYDNSTHKIFGKNYNIKISPPNTLNFETATHIYFEQCENILKENYNGNLILVQIETFNEKNLTNDLIYQVYDEDKNLLNLSECENEYIDIYYSVKKDEELIRLKEQYDIFNISDTLYNDQCIPYSDGIKDLILNDRIKEIYLKYAICQQKGCNYRSFNLDTMLIDCECKVKNDFSGFDQDNYKFNKATNFKILRCHSIFFSFKDILFNLGFWVFLFLNIINLFMIILLIYKGLDESKNYIIIEMYKFGFLKENEINNILAENKSRKKSKRLRHPPKTCLSNMDINIYKKNIKNEKIGKNNIQSMTVDKLISSIENNNIDDNSADINIIKIRLNQNYFLYDSKNSGSVLNNYSFEEAKKYDNRVTCDIYYIFLLSKQLIYHAFKLNNPLEVSPVRICLLILVYSSYLFFNAFFYFDIKISQRYYSNKSIYIFGLTNNLDIILASIIVGYLFKLIFFNLSNSSNQFMNIFKGKENKMTRKKCYQISNKEKKMILRKMLDILKCLKIKLFFFFLFEFSFMLFFWYYVTLFCYIYNKTQYSWIVDGIYSICFTIIINFIISFILATIYKFSIKNKIKCLYYIMLFIYNYC